MIVTVGRIDCIQRPPNLQMIKDVIMHYGGTWVFERTLRFGSLKTHGKKPKAASRTRDSRNLSPAVAGMGSVLNSSSAW